MKSIYCVIFIGFILLFLGPDPALAQQTEPGTTVDDSEVIELDVTEIRITIEKPQVTLFSERIRPEFDELHLEKSFMKEIIGEGERFVFEESRDRISRERIDVDKMLKKVR